MRAGPLSAIPTAILISAALAAAAGCTAPDEETQQQSGEISETDALFGDDRVADALRGNLEAVPKSYAEAEKLFGVGRACARTDSKEIYVVEEAQTRLDGEASRAAGLLPRAVVTGCNTPEHAIASARDPLSGSFGLMIALFSDPDAADESDPMVVKPVEVMALDRRTGLYNFYVFAPGAKSTDPATVKRVRLMPDDEVVVYEMAAGQKTVKKVKPETRECNSCHVNMGPLMNELHEPWTNWVSTRKTLPSETKLRGETRSIVDEAVSLDGSHGRSSFANDLEKTMTSAIRVWVEGLPGVPGSGFVQANIDGDQPRGVEGMLESVFCQTELQYESAFEVAPLELFVDPGAVQGGRILRPRASADETFPVLMPVRSEMDKRIELGLVKKRVLSNQTALAIRLFDEDADVFSDKRCALLPKVKSALPTTAADVDAHLRGVLQEEIHRIPEGASRDYAAALLRERPDAGEITKARTAYLEETRRRLEDEVAKLETPEGRTELKKRSQARKDAAREMFPGARVPLPILPPEKL